MLVFDRVNFRGVAYHSQWYGGCDVPFRLAPLEFIQEPRLECSWRQSRKQSNEQFARVRCLASRTQQENSARTMRRTDGLHLFDLFAYSLVH